MLRYIIALKAMVYVNNPVCTEVPAIGFFTSFIDEFILIQRPTSILLCGRLQIIPVRAAKSENLCSPLPQLSPAYLRKVIIWYVVYSLSNFVILLLNAGGVPYPTLTNTELYQLLNKGYRMERPDMCCDEV